MTFKKVLPPEIEVIPPCGLCKHYKCDLREGESGAVAGLCEMCEKRFDIKVWKNRPGCMLHSIFLSQLDLDSPDPLSVIMPDIYQLTARVEHNIGGAIRDVVSAYAMDGGSGLTTGPGLNGIIEIISTIVKAILEPVIVERVASSIESHMDLLTEHTNAYVECSISTLKKELIEHVQNNGEVPRTGSGGD